MVCVMKFLVTCSLKCRQKIMDSRTCHSHGELRIVRFPDRNATLTEGVHGHWIRIEESPEVVMPGHHKLNGGCFLGNDFYVTTFGQVLQVNVLAETHKTLWTASFLNDLHFVGFFNNRMYVVNTGLERIEVVNLADGADHAHINLLEHIHEAKEFDWSIDYRHVWSTQPHLVHANHCFFLDGEVWVTRFCQKDALALDTGRRIDLSPWGNPHDGCVQDDNVDFTTTNGHLISYSSTEARFRSWDLNRIIGENQLGWCRGLTVEENHAFIAFTQFRSSVTKEMGKWILQGGNHGCKPTFIVKLDMAREKIMAKYHFLENNLTIYGIYRV
jgi:hypothetical protein